jgi:hypothetical protein
MNNEKQLIKLLKSLADVVNLANDLEIDISKPISTAIRTILKSYKEKI